MDNKLFVVGLGYQDSVYNSYSSLNESVYVLASDYGQAKQKAEQYIEFKTKEVKSVLYSDGSLRKPEDKTQIIKEIKLLTEEVVL